MEVPKRIILDSTILIKHLRLRKEEVHLIESLEAKSALATTIINAFEVYYGAYKSKSVASNLASTRGFLSTLTLLTLDESSAEKSGQMLVSLEARGQTIEARDLFIGCIAVDKGYTVLTHNKQHFQKIPGLHAITPSELTL